MTPVSPTPTALEHTPFPEATHPERNGPASRQPGYRCDRRRRSIPIRTKDRSSQRDERNEPPSGPTQLRLPFGDASTQLRLPFVDEP